MADLEITDVSGEQPEPSLRETLLDAVDTHSGEGGGVDAGGEGGAAPEDPSASVTEAAQGKPRVRDEAGRFTKEAPAAKPAVKPAEGAAKVEAKPAPAAPVQAFKGPQSWKPAAREALAKAPPEVQQEVMRRENEIQRTLQETASARKLQASFQQLMSPYQAFIRAENSNDFQAIDNMMRTAVGLRTFPAQQRAELMAGMCHQFGIDPALLDQAWYNLTQGHGTQRQPPPRQAQPSPQQFRDPRLDPIVEAFNQRQQAEYEDTQAEMGKFAESHQFFEDVRAPMADIIELRAKRGLHTTWDEAYDMACRSDPDVAPLYQQAQEAERARTAGAGTQRARAAAGSLRASPGIRTPQAADPTDLRALVTESFEAAQRR